PRQKYDLRLRLLLFDVALKEGDKEGVDRALEGVRTTEQGAGTFYRYGQALRLIWLAKQGGEAGRGPVLEEARQHLDRVLTLRPNWSPVFLARAEIAEMKGNPEQAIKDLQEAVNHGDTSLGVVRRLATLLAERGRDGEAELLLRNLGTRLSLDSDLGRLAVGV